MKILLVRLGTKGGRENILRTSKYRDMSKFGMRKGNSVKNNAHLIRTGTLVIRIMVVPVAASDTSPNDSDTNGGGGDPDLQ